MGAKRKGKKNKYEEDSSEDSDVSILRDDNRRGRGGGNQNSDKHNARTDRHNQR